MPRVNPNLAAGASGVVVALVAALMLLRPEASAAPLRRKLEAALEDKAAVLRELDKARQWSSSVVAQSERQQASCREAQETAAELEREARDLRRQLRAAAYPYTGATRVPAQIGADDCEVCPPLTAAAPPSGALTRLGHSSMIMLSGVAKEVVVAPPSGAARPSGADDVTLSITVGHLVSPNALVMQIPKSSRVNPPSAR